MFGLFVVFWSNYGGFECFSCLTCYTVFKSVVLSSFCVVHGRLLGLVVFGFGGVLCRFVSFVSLIHVLLIPSFRRSL